MCIRDSGGAAQAAQALLPAVRGGPAQRVLAVRLHTGPWPCLLYTSDAADERSSGDLGGRRIIKKKKQQEEEKEVTI